jgi:hypothetical protein
MFADVRHVRLFWNWAIYGHFLIVPTNVGKMFAYVRLFALGIWV